VHPQRATRASQRPQGQGGKGRDLAGATDELGVVRLVVGVLALQVAPVRLAHLPPVAPANAMPLLAVTCHYLLGSSCALRFSRKSTACMRVCGPNLQGGGTDFGDRGLVGHLRPQELRQHVEEVGEGEVLACGAWWVRRAVCVCGWCCLSQQHRASGVLRAVGGGGKAHGLAESTREAWRRYRCHCLTVGRLPCMAASQSPPPPSASTIRLRYGARMHAAEPQRQADRQVLAISSQLAHHAEAIAHVARSLGCARGRGPHSGQASARQVPTYQPTARARGQWRKMKHWRAAVGNVAPLACECTSGKESSSPRSRHGWSTGCKCAMAGLAACTVITCSLHHRPQPPTTTWQPRTRAGDFRRVGHVGKQAAAQGGNARGGGGEGGPGP